MVRRFYSFGLAGIGRTLWLSSFAISYFPFPFFLFFFRISPCVFRASAPLRPSSQENHA
jgi:hypothetical protein